MKGVKALGERGHRPAERGAAIVGYAKECASRENRKNQSRALRAGLHRRPAEGIQCGARWTDDEGFSPQLVVTLNSHRSMWKRSTYMKAKDRRYLYVASGSIPATLRGADTTHNGRRTLPTSGAGLDRRVRQDERNRLLVLVVGIVLHRRAHRLLLLAGREGASLRPVPRGDAHGGVEHGPKGRSSLSSGGQAGKSVDLVPICLIL